jgi:uncharacterized protein YqiB (DUF1249 family)
MKKENCAESSVVSAGNIKMCLVIVLATLYTMQLTLTSMHDASTILDLHFYTVHRIDRNAYKVCISSR